MASPPPLNFVIPATRTETRREPLKSHNLPPLFPENITIYNFHNYLNPFNVVVILGPIMVVFYGINTITPLKPTLVWSAIYCTATLVSITAGYHRYWSHRSYSASQPLRVALALFGAGAVQGSIKWWSRGHRAHHGWTDTEKDPYSAHRGLIFSHIGWMLVHRPQWKIGHADTDDLEKDKLVQWQHRNYFTLAFIMGFAVPALIPGIFWDDWRGGFYYATMVRMVLCHHATFCVNSLAHYIGDSPFDDKHTPRNHLFTALVSFGEGYHNFHHQFPRDYRNAIRFYQYDPTKWFIFACSCLGLASNLKTFPENEIQKGLIHIAEKKLLNRKTKLTWGTPISKLPIISFREYQNACKVENKEWILIEGIVYDVIEFINNTQEDQNISKQQLEKI